MATARSAEKEAFWRMAIHEHQSSGLTIKAFCKQQGISQPSFYAWRRKLKKRDTDDESPRADHGTLVPVRLVDEQEDLSGNFDCVTLRIATPSGLTVDVAADWAGKAAGIAVELERHWQSMGGSSC